MALNRALEAWRRIEEEFLSAIVSAWDRDDANEGDARRLGLVDAVDKLDGLVRNVWIGGA